jgi:hypothetical protein
MNTYQKFEKKITTFCYDFAKSLDQELQDCELLSVKDKKAAEARVANIVSCLADIAGDMSNWEYARAILDKTLEKARDRRDKYRQ